MMKILYISNFLNLHQSTLWDLFVKNDVSFCFLSTSNVSKEDNKPIETRDYCKYSLKMSDEVIRAFLDEFEIIIIGAVEDNRIFRYLPKNRIYFWNGEHFFKKKFLRLFRIARQSFCMRRRLKGIRPYLLCNSSYLSQSFGFMMLPYKMSFRFSYFPPTNNKIASLRQSNSYKLTYIGRLLDWKRPLVSLNVLRLLIGKHANARLEIIGEGKMLPAIMAAVKRFNLSDRVTFNRFIPHDHVLYKLCQTDIFVFASNHKEGWGAVLNEAMSCGCVVFACSLAGSTNYLIKDGYNGFTWKTKKELKKKIELFESMTDDEIWQIRINAYKTINGLWNEKVAAERLYAVCRSLFNQEKVPNFSEGPMSIESK